MRIEGGEGEVVVAVQEMDEIEVVGLVEAVVEHAEGELGELEGNLPWNMIKIRCYGIWEDSI